MSETTSCDPSVREPNLGATCCPSAAPRRAAPAPSRTPRESANTPSRVPVRWIIDPRLGLCSAVTGRRYLQVVVGDTVVARSSPSMRVDLVLPQAPLSVVASLGGPEQTATITWGYATPDAGTVAVDSEGTRRLGHRGRWRRRWRRGCSYGGRCAGGHGQRAQRRPGGGDPVALLRAVQPSAGRSRRPRSTAEPVPRSPSRAST